MPVPTSHLLAALKLKKKNHWNLQFLDIKIPSTTNTHNMVIFLSCNRKNILILIPYLNINSQALCCGFHIHPWKISEYVNFDLLKLKTMNEFLLGMKIKVLVSLRLEKSL